MAGVETLHEEGVEGVPGWPQIFDTCAKIMQVKASGLLAKTILFSLFLFTNAEVATAQVLLILSVSQ